MKIKKILAREMRMDGRTDGRTDGHLKMKKILAREKNENEENPSQRDPDGRTDGWTFENEENSSQREMRMDGWIDGWTDGRHLKTKKILAREKKENEENPSQRDAVS